MVENKVDADTPDVDGDGDGVGVGGKAQMREFGRYRIFDRAPKELLPRCKHLGKPGDERCQAIGFSRRCKRAMGWGSFESDSRVESWGASWSRRKSLPFDHLTWIK